MCRLNSKHVHLFVTIKSVDIKFIAIQTMYNIVVLLWTYNCNKMNKNNGKIMSQTVS
jgi:hypothetical protein